VSAQTAHKAQRVRVQLILLLVHALLATTALLRQVLLLATLALQEHTAVALACTLCSSV
jgi:hypothetical protein